MNGYRLLLHRDPDIACTEAATIVSVIKAAPLYRKGHDYRAVASLRGSDNQWLQRPETITSRRRVLPRIDAFLPKASVRGVPAVRT
jgi:hypothetical protein